MRFPGTQRRIIPYGIEMGFSVMIS
jgi:hypothetical protein